MMKRILSARWYLFGLILLFSCQKEISSDVLGNTTPNNLIGTWKFIDSHVITNSIVEVNDGTSDVKTITFSDYTTQNNQGSLTISDSLMIANGLGYDLSTTAHSYTYENGNLDDSTDFPFTFSVAPASSSSAYTRIGTDSIHTSTGVISSIAGSNGGTDFSPGGYHYLVTGDTLLLSSNYSQTSVDNSAGVPVMSTDAARVVSTLKRQ